MNKALKFILFFIELSLSLALFFLRLFIRRNNNLIIIMGKDNGKLMDNCKYILPALKTCMPDRTEIIYVTSHEEVFKSLENMGFRSFLRKNFCDAAVLFLRAGIVIVDSIDWSKDWKHAFLRGAKLIQLWHGIPLKEIEVKKANRFINDKALLIKIAAKIYWRLTFRFPVFDALISTSEFSNKLLSSCINNKHAWITGYPRNDVLLKGNLTKFDLLNVDKTAKENINQIKTCNGKIIFYCPTFRDGMKNPILQKIDSIEKIGKFLKRRNIFLFIKLHPWISDVSIPKHIENIYLVSSDTDPYPLLRDVDILITDYSSIYFDFLLLDKPIIFFPYDLAHYQNNEREIMIDYNCFTPGHKEFTLSQLLRRVFRILNSGTDDFETKRIELSDLMFFYKDSNAADRVSRLILQEMMS